MAGQLGAGTRGRGPPHRPEGGLGDRAEVVDPVAQTLRLEGQLLQTSEDLGSRRPGDRSCDPPGRVGRGPGPAQSFRRARPHRPGTAAVGDIRRRDRRAGRANGRAHSEGDGHRLGCGVPRRRFARREHPRAVEETRPDHGDERARHHGAERAGNIEAGNQEIFNISVLSEGRVLQFFWADPHKSGIIDELESKFELWRFKGIKLHQPCHPFKVNSFHFRDIAEFAARKGIPVFLHLYSKNDVLEFISVSGKYNCAEPTPNPPPAL